MRKFIFYLIRWQLSTPILWIVVKSLGVGLWQTMAANLIGGSIFYYVDKFIFTSKAIEMWHFKESGRCDQCGKETTLWRLVLSPGYDQRQAEPKYLCQECSRKKTQELRKKGIKIICENKQNNDEDSAAQ